VEIKKCEVSHSAPHIFICGVIVGLLVIPLTMMICCIHDDYLRELKGKLSAMSVLLQPPPPLLPSIRSTVDQATGNPVEGSLSTGYVQPPMQPVTLVMNSQFVSSAYPVMMYPPMKNAFAVRAVPQNAFAVQAVPQMQNIPINGGDHLPQVPLGGSAYQHGANHTNTENMGTTNVGAMKMGTMNMGTMNVGTMNVGTMNVGRSSASPPSMPAVPSVASASHRPMPTRRCLVARRRLTTSAYEPSRPWPDSRPMRVGCS
jgi:hypothetical protein